jgi:hypothetical protein
MFQPAALYGSLDFFAIFGRSGREFSSVFSIRDRLPFPCVFGNEAYICEAGCHFLLVWKRDAERNLEASLRVYIV